MATTEMHSNDGQTSIADRPSYDDVNTAVIFMVGIISAILTIVIIAFVQGLSYHWERSFSELQNAKYSASLVKPIIDAQKKDLEGGEGTLPITVAMQQVVEEYGRPGAAASGDQPAPETRPAEANSDH